MIGSGSDAGRRALALVLAAGTAGLVLAGCNGAKVEGEGRLDPEGRVVLTRDDKPITVTSARSLVTGDKVEVAEGSAKVELPGGDVLELRARSVLSLARGPELRSGDMLVSSGGTRTVRAAGNQVDAVGATRIDVTLAVRVVAYGGHAVIRSAGKTVDVPALREASVPVVGVVRGPLPLAIDRGDGWDQRFLGEAAEKEADVESKARGFTGQVSLAHATSAAYYRSLLPALAGEPGFQQADVDRLGRAALDSTERASADRIRGGDVLVGAAVALQGRRGTFSERLAGAAAFRGEGAPWTLIALDQQVPSVDGLVRLVDAAVNVAPLELATPGTTAQAAAVASEPPPARATPTTRPPTRTTATTRPARPAPTPTTPSTTAPTQQPPAPVPGRPPIVLPVDPILDAAVDPVVNLLNNLLGSK